MFRLIYELIIIILMPLIIVRLFIRGHKVPGYRKRIRERFGFFEFPNHFDSTKPTIWLHAVSVGEVLAAQPLVIELKKLYPQYQIFITTMTPTGSEQVSRLFSTTIFHSYLPYDSSLLLVRFINNLRPKLLIIMETEIWPNLLNIASAQGVKILLANARLSEKSASGYSKFGGLFKKLLNRIDKIGAQSKSDSKRFIKLGATPDKITVTGSLKYHMDIRGIDEKSGLLFRELSVSPRKIITAASTREGEEEKVIISIRSILQKFPEALFIIVPRHPERFDKVFSLLKKSGLNCERRSSTSVIAKDTQVLVGDSLGEMHSYYGVSDIAFVGGSLVDMGCHNVLEPAALALPILAGPSQYNFSEICSRLEKAGGLLTVRNEYELSEEIIKLLFDKSKRLQMGEAAKKELLSNQESLPSLVNIVDQLLSMD